MRYGVIPLLAFALVAMTYGGSAVNDPAEGETDWASLALPPETFSDIVPKAPGPYTGPSDEAIPDGWKRWAHTGGDDDVDQQCGPITLVFLNADLQHDDNGLIHAQGSFFIQFQAVGEGADAITRFSFSFGKTTSDVSNNPTLNCNEDLPDSQLGTGTGGAYLLFYRSDFNKDDGFFVPIETRNVPDGEYGAAVHAYTGNDLTGYTEVARAWAMAVVDNCKNEATGPNMCPDDTEAETRSMDKTMPWPMVLPGDGEQTNDVDGLTVEVLEDLGSGSSDALARAQEALDADRIQASLNGEPLELEAWEPPPRDRDVIPLNDGGLPTGDGCPGGQNVRGVCQREVYSTGFKWEGPIECDDIIKVTVTDPNGNVVTKQIHNCKTFGGSSEATVPIISWKNEGSDLLRVNAGNEANYNMRLENIGGGTAHVNLFLEYNETVMEAFWEQIQNEHSHAPGGEDEHETHVEIAGGEATTLKIVVKPKSDAPEDVYDIRAGLEYHASGELQQDWRDLTVDVASEVEKTNETGNSTDDDKTVEEDTPGFGAVLVVGSVLGLVAVAGRGRRS